MKKLSSKKHQDSKFILEELEARQLFSGGIEGLIDTELESPLVTYVDIDASSDQTPTQQDTTSTTSAAEQKTQEIVFVDTEVENYQELIDDILNNSDSDRNIEVVLLASDQNGINKISESLQNRDDLDAIHIISHGDDGSVQLGNTRLNADTLAENNLAIALWANAFAETGDILIYGCNLAESDVGQSLINSLSDLTLTDVAASDDLTGSATLGGDWDLEYTAGQIETEIAVSVKQQKTYEAVLLAETVADDLGTGDYTGNTGSQNWTGNWIETDDGGAGASGGEIYVDGTDLRVRARVDGDNIYREADLSAATSATLTFDVVDNRLSNSDKVRLEISNDGGGNWSTLKDFTASDPNTSSESFDITSQIAANTRVRFLVVGNGDDRIHIDNIQIQYTTSTAAPNNLTTISSTGGGLSLNEDGGNDAYLIADDGGAILGGLTSLTAEVRFSMQSFPNSTNFFSYATASDDNVFKFNIRDDGDLSVSINSVKVNSSAMDYRTLADGKPHTLSVTWDSAGGLWEMYVDGVSMDNGSGLESGVTITGGGTLIMGNDQDSVDGGYDPAAEAAATLYDARIFNDVRTATEISNNYDQTLANTESGMLANWRFDDLSLDGAVTESVSDNNFTVKHASGAGFVTSTPSLTLSVSEAAPDATVAGSVLATDPDTGDSYTYSLLDDAGGRFAINGSTGQITVADSSLINFESASSHNITIRVTDSGGLFYDEVFTVLVSDVPITTVSASGTATASAGGTYTLNLAADETATSWTINWGDGEIETVVGDPSSVTHTYTAGSTGLTYNILVSATDGTGTHFDNNLVAATSFLTGEGLYRYSDSGTFDQYFSGAELTNPYAMVVGPDGLLYVAGHTSDNIVRYNAETGAFVDTFVSTGSGGLNAAAGLAFGADGHLYVSNQIGDSILKYDGSTGAFLSTFVSTGSGGLNGPVHLSFRPDGYLYVGSYNNDSILRYNAATGAYVDTFISAGSGGLNGPGAIAWGSDGNLYIASNNSTVKRYDGSTGAFIDNFVSSGSGGLGEATGLAFGPDGNLYVSSYSSDQIIKYDGITGALIGNYVTPGGDGLDGPVGFTFTPSHQVTVANTIVDAINDSYNTNEDTPLIIDTTANDTDAEGDAISVIEFTQPTNGTVTDNGDGTLTYTPDSEYSGADTFDYVAIDTGSGLQNFWGLDGDAVDAVGGADGTLNGTTTVAGDFGDALSFNETSDYVLLPDVTYASEFTISFDFKIDDNTGSLFQYLYSHGDINTTDSINIFLNEASHGTDPNKLRTVVRDANDTLSNTALEIDIAALIGDGLWHKYTLTAGANGLKVFIDGVSSATDATRGVDGVNPTGGLYLGVRQDLDADRRYGGELDSLQIYGNALDSTQITTLASEQHHGTVNITVDPVNDAPIVDLNISDGTTSSYTTTFTEDGGAVNVTEAGAIISDVDDTEFQQLGINLSNFSDGSNELITIGGYSFTYSVNEVVVRTVGGTDFEIDFDGTGFTISKDLGGNMPLTDVQTLLRSITYENTSQNPTTGNRTLDIQVQDVGGLLSTAAISTITVSAENDAPVVTATGGVTAYTEQATATVIDAGVTLVDPDGFDGTNPSDQFVAVVSITGNYEAADILGFTDTAKIEGSLSGGLLTLSVIGGQTATVAEFEAAMQSVTFYNGSDTPSELNRMISFSFDDAVDSSNVATKTLTVTAVNDVPTANATAINPTYTEGDATVDLFSAVNVSTVESGQTIEKIVLTVTNVTDGSNETITLDGSIIYLVNGDNDTTGSGYDYVVDIVGNAATITIDTVGTSVVDAQNLIDGLGYKNTSQSPTEASREITISSITDSGSGTNTSNPNITSSVNVVAINDAPVLTNGNGLTFTTINEDAINNSGDLISTILASSGGNPITDVDAGALEGIAITGLNSSQGTWEYNTGSGWTAVGTVSFTESLLLRATDSLRFVPDELNADTASVTFAAWDQTSGTAGTKVDTNTYGGATAFSAVLESAVITVTGVNDAPTVSLTNIVNTLSESTDTSSNVKIADIVITDDALGSESLILSGADSASFTIVGTELFLKAGTALDFETKTSFDVTVEVDDATIGVSSEDTVAHTLSITDVNEAPTVSLTNIVNTLSESTDTSSNVKIADIVITDDALGSESLILSGADAASFTIVGTELFLKAGTALDFETKTSFDVTVEVDDATIGVSSEDTVAHSLGITDVNEAPTVSLTNIVNTLSESTDTSSNVKIADIVITDDALGSESLILSGADATSFTIVGTELFLKAGTALDFETKTSFDVTVEVDDATIGVSSEDTVAHSLGITDVNEAPTVSLTNIVNTLSESTDTSSNVKIADIVITDDALGSESLILSGADAASFTIVGTELFLKAGTALDFETKTSYDVTVEVDDATIGVSSEDTVAHTLSITDVNEAPTVSLTNIVNTLSEAADTSSNVKIADIVITDDALGSESLILSGADAASFTIVGTELFLKAGTTLDFETKTSFDVTVEVDDATIGVSSEDTVAHSLGITDVNEAPTVSLTNIVNTLSESTDTSSNVKIADIVITDDALGSESLILSGAYSASFTIVGAELFLKAGTSLDFETKTSFDVTVEVDDATIGVSSEDTVAHTLSITDVNEAPTVSLTNIVNTLSESTDTSSNVKIADIVITDDALGSESLILSGADSASFTIVGTELFLKAGTALDFETKTSFDVTVEVDDATLGVSSEDTVAHTLSITDVNEAPTVSLTNIVNTLSESTDTSSNVKIADIVVTDDALGSESLILSGTDASSFTIIGTELFLKAGTALDFETKTSFDVTVEVDDATIGVSSEDTVAHSLGITDANEAPNVSLTNVVNTLSESTDTSSNVKIADIVITDDALGSESLILSGADAASFTIVGTELFLIAGTTLNFETKTSFDVTVEVDDATIGVGSEDTVAHTLSITDVNEAPTVSLTNIVNTLSESTDTSSNVKIADIVITDDALGSESLILSGTDASSFTIIGTELFLKAGTALDFETKTSFDVTVEVDDATIGVSYEDTVAHSLGITDANEAPTVSLTNIVNTLSEAADTSSNVKIADIVITDDALGTESLILSGADSASFTIVGTELFLKAGTALDFETKTSFDVTVEVNDATIGVSSEDTVAHSLGITDANESPTVSLTNIVNTLSESTDTSSNVKIADIVITDDALGTESLILSGADSASFTIVGTELFLKAGTALDFETKTSFDVTVEVDDATLGVSSEDTVAHTLSITDVNEAPTVSLTNIVNTLSEAADTSSNVKIADIVITDDALGSESLILSGADSASFTIVGTELFLIAGTTLNFETKTSFDVTVEVNDATIGVSSEDTVAHTLGITDVNEAPTVSLTNIVNTLSESTDTSSNVKIADIVITDDALGSESLILSGADATSFTIVGTELFLKAGTTLDFETKTSFDVTVEVDDVTIGVSSEDTVAHSLGITDANEAPTVSLTNIVNTLSESTDTSSNVKIADIVITDDALGSESLILSGADSASFTIVGTELFLKAGTALDFETKTSFDVTVEVDDATIGVSSEDTVAHTLSITDVNEAPTVSLTNIVNTLSESTDTSSNVKIADIVITDDALGSESLILSGADAASFTIIGTELFLKAGTALDFETKTSFDVTVEVDDATIGVSSEDTVAHTLSITDVNEAPTVSLTNIVNTLSEAADTSSNVKIADIVITDDALGSESLILSGADSASFTIVGTELFLKAGTALDFETKTSFDVTVEIDDATIGVSSEDTVAHTLSITDVNEAPTVSLTNIVNTLSEAADTSSNVKIADIVITDDALGSESLILSGADAASFTIVGTELFLKAGTALDFETKTSFDVTVEVDDATIGVSSEDTVAHTLSITDVNEAPTVSLTNVVNTLSEATDTSSNVKIADIVVTDDALGSESLILSGADSASFTIVGTELFLKAGTALDFETKTSFDVTVEVDDATIGVSSEDTVAHTLSITDVNEAPTVSLTNIVNTLSEAADTSSNVKIADIVITDDALGSESLILSGADSASFAIVGTELFLKAGTTLNFATKTSFDVTVEVDDASIGVGAEYSVSHNLDISSVEQLPIIIENNDALNDDVVNTDNITPSTNQQDNTNQQQSSDEPLIDEAVITNLDEHIEKLITASKTSNNNLIEGFRLFDKSDLNPNTLKNNTSTEVLDQNSADFQHNMTKSSKQINTLTNLVINQFEFDFYIDSDNDLDEQEEHALWDRVDKMRKQMNSNQAQGSNHQVDVQIVLGSTISLTAGFVSWVLRGGSLLASFISTVPLLNRFDPLPILKSRTGSISVVPNDNDEDESIINENKSTIDELFSNNQQD